jgi:hypothetical protein
LVEGEDLVDLVAPNLVRVLLEQVEQLGEEELVELYPLS